MGIGIIYLCLLAFVLLVILLLINEILFERCEKKIIDICMYYENNICLAFYEATSELLKCYETFNNKTKELEAAYEWLLSLKKISKEGKDGLDVWLKEWKINLEKDEQRLKELEELDKNKYEHALEIYNKNRSRYYICYKNHIDGECFDYDELLKDANCLIEVMELFNSYFIEIEKGKKCDCGRKTKN